MSRCTHNWSVSLTNTLLWFHLKVCFYPKKRAADKKGIWSCSFCARAPGGQIDRSWGLLSTNRSEKTALVITTPRSSTRSFANDLAPRLSNRRMHQLGSGPCRAHVRSDVGSSNSPTAVQLCLSPAGHECIVAFQTGFWLRGVQS